MGGEWYEAGWDAKELGTGEEGEERKESEMWAHRRGGLVNVVPWTARGGAPEGFGLDNSE